MTLETPTTDTDPTEEKDPAWYREQMAAKDAETAELKKQLNKQKVKLMETAFAQVGLDPTKGIGKAVAKEFDGDPDADAIRQYAIEEYQWEPPADQGQGHPLADDIAGAQGRVSAAIQGAESNPTEQIDLDIAQAEERGDFASTIQLKLAKFRQNQGI